MQYFDKVFINRPNNVELRAPIQLFETIIFKDNVDNEILLRDQFLNSGNQPVIAIFINIFMKNILGEDVPAPDGSPSLSYTYQDICIPVNDTFGRKIPIALPSDVRRVTVLIDKAVLQDGTLWTSDSHNIVSIQEQEPLQLPDDFLESFDQANDVKPVFYYTENESCWQCTCGQPNFLTSWECDNCGRQKEATKRSFSKETIIPLYEGYKEEKAREEAIRDAQRKHEAQIAEEKRLEIERQRQLEVDKLRSEMDQKAHKKKMIIGSVCAGAVLIIAALIVIFYPSSKKLNTYRLGVSYMESHDFASAKMEFLKIPGFKDTDSILENYDIDHRKYLDEQGALKRIPDDELNDETATAAVQAAVDEISLTISHLDGALNGFVNNKPKEKASFVINTFLSDIRSLDNAIISLKTLGDNASVKKIQEDGIEISMELQDVCWAIVEELDGYDYIKSDIFFEVIENTVSESLLSDIFDWYRLIGA